MRISKQMTADYPNLSRWIIVNIPKVLDKSKIFYAFMKYSELSHADVIKTLTTYSPPVLHVWTFAENYDGLPGRKNGTSVRTRQGYPGDWIFLAKIICEKFETSKTHAEDARMHLLLESTILHEMVHWGDTLDGKRQKQHEEGKQFEREAYGRQVNRYWKGT